MIKPVEPNKDDCCNSGCNPCIFDIYEQQLKLYEKHLKGEKTVNKTEENGIKQLEYTTLFIVNNVNLCPSHNLITFKRESVNTKNIWWNPGDHFLFKYSLNGISCTRAYTPINVKDKTDSDIDFGIIVKKYDTGLVSPYLCNLEEGSTTLWRGPYGQYELKPNEFQRIIMIAQGTGIAPFITIIDNILSNEDDMTKIVLIYCCKSIDTVLFRDELYDYKSYWNFCYQLYISTALPNEKLKYQEPVINSKLCFESLNNFEPFASKDQFLICGSQQFNQYYDIHVKKEHPTVENIIVF